MITFEELIESTDERNFIASFDAKYDDGTIHHIELQFNNGVLESFDGFPYSLKKEIWGTAIIKALSTKPKLNVISLYLNGFKFK